MAAQTTDPVRRLLLLGGPVGPFFTLLARALGRRGWRVERCVFNLGDRLFGLGGAVALTPDAVDRLLEAPPWDVVVAFGVDRPRHAAMLDRLGPRGVPVLCLEEGYVRPGFVCAEWGGSHARSPLLRPPSRREDHRDAAAVLEPDAGIAPAQTQALISIVQLNVIKIGERLGFGAWHRDRSVVAEFFRWHVTLARRLWRRRADQARTAALIASGRRFRVVALQVHDDANLVRNGAGLAQPELIDRIARAFAANAPADERLLFKIHPLDAGHCDYRGMVAAAAARHGVASRVDCVCDVPLGPTVKASVGVVTVNSTSGLSGLHHGVQTDILGHAFYEGPGLARHCDDPALIWTEPHRPDRQAFNALILRVYREALTPGSFYGLGAAQRLAERIAARVEEPSASGQQANSNL